MAGTKSINSLRNLCVLGASAVDGALSLIINATWINVIGFIIGIQVRKRTTRHKSSLR
jgi:hypothetical protein